MNYLMVFCLSAFFCFRLFGGTDIVCSKLDLRTPLNQVLEQNEDALAKTPLGVSLLQDPQLRKKLLALSEDPASKDIFDLLVRSLDGYPVAKREELLQEYARLPYFTPHLSSQSPTFEDPKQVRIRAVVSVDKVPVYMRPADIKRYLELDAFPDFAKALEGLKHEYKKYNDEKVRALFKRELAYLETAPLKRNETREIQLEIGETVDEEAFRATKLASEIWEENPGQLGWTQAEKAMIFEMKGAFDRFMSARYSGHNMTLKTHNFTNLKRTNYDGPVGRFLEEGMFAQSGWWLSSEKDKLATITAETSQSLLRRSPGRKRVMYWPSVDYGGKRAELSRLRVSVNFDEQGTKNYMEVMYRTETGWEPFYFQRIAGTWVPAQTVDGIPVRKLCLNCHGSLVKPPGITAKATVLVSPIPAYILKSKEKLESVGYKDPDLIHDLMTAH